MKNQTIQRYTENSKDGQLGPHPILENTILSYPILTNKSIFQILYARIVYYIPVRKAS